MKGSSLGTEPMATLKSSSLKKIHIVHERDIPMPEKTPVVNCKMHAVISRAESSQD